ncbi:MAG: hypothetical protein ABR507_01205 [Actinomycetota bacterium]
MNLRKNNRRSQTDGRADWASGLPSEHPASRLELGDIFTALNSLNNHPALASRSTARSEASSGGIDQLDLESRLARIENKIARAVRFENPALALEAFGGTSANADIDLSSALDELRLNGHHDADDGAIWEELESGPRYSKNPAQHRRMAPWAAGLVVFALVSIASMVLISSQAKPGSALRGIRMSIEGLRVATAGSHVAKAESLTRSAASRLGELRSMSATDPEMPRTMLEMAAADSSAVRQLIASRADERRILAAGTLNAIATSQQRFLAGIYTSVPASLTTVLGRALTASSDAVRVTASILDPDGQDSLNPPSSPQNSSPVSTSGGVKIRRRSSAKVSRSAGTQVGGAQGQAPTSTGSAGSSNEPQPPRCETSAGDICLKAPTVPQVP